MVRERHAGHVCFNFSDFTFLSDEVANVSGDVIMGVDSCTIDSRFRQARKLHYSTVRIVAGRVVLAANSKCVAVSHCYQGQQQFWSNWLMHRRAIATSFVLTTAVDIIGPKKS